MWAIGNRLPSPAKRKRPLQCRRDRGQFNVPHYTAPVTTLAILQQSRQENRQENRKAKNATYL
jgi:hypothetical protein